MLKVLVEDTLHVKESMFFYPIVFSGCFCLRSSFDRQRVTHYNVHASTYDTPRYQTQLISKFEAHTIIPSKQDEQKYLRLRNISISLHKSLLRYS